MRYLSAVLLFIGLLGCGQQVVTPAVNNNTSPPKSDKCKLSDEVFSCKKDSDCGVSKCEKNGECRGVKSNFAPHIELTDDLLVITFLDSDTRFKSVVLTMYFFKDGGVQRVDNPRQDSSAKGVQFTTRLLKDADCFYFKTEHEYLKLRDFSLNGLLIRTVQIRKGGGRILSQIEAICRPQTCLDTE